jgi:hypothetical protein
MRKRFFILPVLILFLVVACATTVDQKITYLTARDTFNSALANYSDRVRAMAPGEEKDSIKNSFNPIWKDAEIGLDAWGAVVKGGSALDPMVAIKRYTEAKNKLINLGLKYFGDKLFAE